MAQITFFNNGSFTTVFQEPLQKILSELDLNKNELKILLYAIANCQTDNVIETNSSFVSAFLHIDVSNVKKAIRSLRQKKIIVEEDGQTLLNLTKFSKVNYHLAYSGKPRKKNWSKIFVMLENKKVRAVCSHFLS